jgi:hypothetical protein
MERRVERKGNKRERERENDIEETEARFAES